MPHEVHQNTIEEHITRIDSEPRFAVDSVVAEADGHLQRASAPLVVAIAIITALTLIGCYFAWQYATAYENTDDAYAIAHIHPVYNRVDGTVIAVYVDDNQQVKKGQPLVQLDPVFHNLARDSAQSALLEARCAAQQALATISMNNIQARGATESASGGAIEASASLGAARDEVSQCKMEVAVAVAELAKIRAEEKFSNITSRRYIQLWREGAVAREEADRWLAYYEQDQAAEQAALKRVEQAKGSLGAAEQVVAKTQGQVVSSQGQRDMSRAAESQLDVDRARYQICLAEVEKRKAALRDAEVCLSLTTVRAMAAGRVGNKTVEIGQRLQEGRELMDIVENLPWIVANFKETQVRRMRPSQPVEIKLDAIPDRSFQGHVESVAPATGNQFALLPTDNATGNFTKIVQRIPVKIVFVSGSLGDWQAQISPGMSAVVRVKVR